MNTSNRPQIQTNIKDFDLKMNQSKTRRPETLIYQLSDYSFTLFSLSRISSVGLVEIYVVNKLTSV